MKAIASWLQADRRLFGVFVVVLCTFTTLVTSDLVCGRAPAMVETEEERRVDAQDVVERLARINAKADATLRRLQVVEMRASDVPALTPAASAQAP